MLKITNKSGKTVMVLQDDASEPEETEHYHKKKECECGDECKECECIQEEEDEDGST